MFGSLKHFLKSSQVASTHETHLVGAEHLKKSDPNLFCYNFCFALSFQVCVTEAYGSILLSFVTITLEPEVAISGSLFLIKWDVFKMFCVWGRVVVMEREHNNIF